jgi:hypothetical protein
MPILGFGVFQIPPAIGLVMVKATAVSPKATWTSALPAP